MDFEKMLSSHALWLGSAGADGVKANLQGANLKYANLQGADLRDADLQDANLQGAVLQGANLRRANLRWANLQGADLRDANLRWANLRGADLRWADLRGADLRWADIDFSCWPLWCGSVGATLDDRQQAQLLYHALSTMDATKHKMLFRYARPFVNKNFHQVTGHTVRPI